LKHFPRNELGIHHSSPFNVNQHDHKNTSISQ
jgi:hypothetical protein